MAEEDLQIVRLKTDFYRDGFKKTIIALSMIIATIILIIAISIYLYVTKPDPVYFTTDNDWRVLAPVPINQPYLSDPDLLQWVSQAIPTSFIFDFLDYKNQLDRIDQYYTTNGWKLFLDLTNIYANYNNIQTNKSFINAKASGAPIIQNRGLVDGKWGWWVQMPIELSTTNISGTSSTQLLVVKALVTRVSTIDNLDGVAIDNIIVTKGGGNQVKSNV